MPNFYICMVPNERACDLQDLTGHVRCAFVAGIWLLMLAEYTGRILPDINLFG